MLDKFMTIDYQTLLDEAMLSIVKKILIKVQDEGLIEEECFYISFRTDYPEVIISKHIRQRYPKEITIVLQYQFKNLQVLRSKFSVNIAFSGVPETIEVPFNALTSFVDPIANFSLQFKRNLDHKLDIRPEAELSTIAIKSNNKISTYDGRKKPGEVIAIDKFRKKQEENNFL